MPLEGVNESATSKIAQRIGLETEFGKARTDGDPMLPVDLNGLGMSSQRGTTATQGFSQTRQGQKKVVGAGAGSGSGNGDFFYKYPGHDLLRSMAFGKAETPAYTKTSTGIRAAEAGNKLVSDNGWGDLEEPALVMVRGLADNGNLFLAPVLAKQGNTLLIDPTVKTLVDEDAGPEVTVWHSGNQSLGVDLLTAFIESLNTGSTRGDLSTGVTCGSWGLQFQYGNNGAQPVQESFNCASVRTTDITAAHGLATATATKYNPYTSGNSFGDALTAGSGFGFRYEGALAPAVRLSQWQLTLTNPMEYGGWGGSNNLRKVMNNGNFTVAFSATFDRIAEPMTDSMAAHADLDLPRSFGFGFNDDGGRRCYVLLPSLLPTSINRGARSLTGVDSYQISYEDFEEPNPLWGQVFLGWFDPHPAAP